MVDVSGKPTTVRRAKGSARVRLTSDLLRDIQAGKLGKGNVLEVARLAGIQAAKRTAELIPLCHTLPLDCIAVDFSFGENLLFIEATATVTSRTGVEMEALVAVSVAALTVYDMCKARDRSIVIERVQLEEKEGGKSGRYVRAECLAETMASSGVAT